MTEEEIKSLVVDSWRLMNTNRNFINEMPKSKQKSAEAKSRNLLNLMLSHIENLLQENNIKMVFFEGKPYDPNYPLRATNTDDFSDGEKLIVRETLEPALVKEGRVLHFAKVVLACAKNSNNQQEKESVSGN